MENMLNTPEMQAWAGLLDLLKMARDTRTSPRDPANRLYAESERDFEALLDFKYRERGLSDKKIFAEILLVEAREAIDRYAVHAHGKYPELYGQDEGGKLQRKSSVDYELALKFKAWLESSKEIPLIEVYSGFNSEPDPDPKEEIPPSIEEYFGVDSETAKKIIEYVKALPTAGKSLALYLFALHKAKESKHPRGLNQAATIRVLMAHTGVSWVKNSRQTLNAALSEIDEKSKDKSDIDSIIKKHLN